MPEWNLTNAHPISISKETQSRFSSRIRIQFCMRARWKFHVCVMWRAMDTVVSVTALACDWTESSKVPWSPARLQPSIIAITHPSKSLRQGLSCQVKSSWTWSKDLRWEYCRDSCSPSSASHDNFHFPDTEMQPHFREPKASSLIAQHLVVPKLRWESNQPEGLESRWCFRHSKWGFPGRPAQ